MADSKQSTRSILLNFILFSVSFSLNGGCVTACLSLASNQLGKSLAGYSSGVLYATYTLTALFVAPAVITNLGTKTALNSGVVLYCMYVASYAVALLFPALKWLAVIFGAFLGGMAAGWLWTAQGGFFGQASEQYAGATGIDMTKATSYLSSVFAGIFLGLELALKLVSTAVLAKGGPDASDTLFITYTTVAVVSAVGMFAVRPVEASEKEDAAKKESTIKHVLKAVVLMQTDIKILLLSPINASFGFMGSLNNFYMCGQLVANTVGPEAIGILASVISGVASAISLPLGALSISVGKTPAMLLGATIFLAEAIVLYIFPEDVLGRWSVLIPLFVAHGVGRAVWEGPNKAVIADMFPNDRPAAFSNMVMQYGVSSAVGYFVYPQLAPSTMVVFSIVSLSLWIVGYLAANAVHWREQANKQQLL